MNTSIVVAGQKFDIGCRVILWDEPGGFSFYRNKKYAARDLDLTALQKEIKNFTLHHSVTWNALQCYSALIGRNLSVNFIIDDNRNADGCATIYQCLDIKDAGWSQTVCNMTGPGCEIALQPAAWVNDNYYNDINQQNFKATPHKRIEDVVHGMKWKCFGPTEAQHNSVIKMLSGFFEAFDLPKAFPKNADGTFCKTVIKEPANFKGVLNHFNIDRNKIDCLGLDIQKIESALNEDIYDHLDSSDSSGCA
jgi:hypothetical protein